MLKILKLLVLTLATTQLVAETASQLKETSNFEKLLLLRFGEEYTYFMDEDNFLDMSHIDESSYMQVRGKLKLLAGEFIEPRYYSEQEFRNFIDESKVEIDFAVGSYPYSIKDLDVNYASFIIKASQPSFKTLTAHFPLGFHGMKIYLVTKTKTYNVYDDGILSKDPKENKLEFIHAKNLPIAEVDSDFYLIGHLSAPLLEDGFPAINMTSFFIGPNNYLGSMLFDSWTYTKSFPGSFGLIAIFYTFIYIFRWRDFSSLYLAIFAISSFLQVAISVKPMGISGIILIDLITGLNMLAIAAIQAYCLEKIRFRFGDRFVRRNMLLVAAIFLPTILGLYHQAYVFVAVLLLASYLYSVIVISTTLYQGVRHRIDGIVFLVFGSISITVFQGPGLGGYLDANASEIGFAIFLGNLGMAIFLALVNAKEFAATFQRSIRQGEVLQEKNDEISFFNKNLEKLVDTKTQEIRSLLDHIPQGVLMIGENGILSKDYSAHVENIIGTETIAERSFLERVLTNTLLSTDEQDQIWQTITASISNNELTWEVNKTRLPQEFIYIDSSKKEKVIQATWNVKVEDEQVEFILVTLLDISHEKELEKIAEAQKEDIEIIQQLVSSPAVSIAAFFDSAEKLLSENRSLISSNIQLADNHIRLLFVNAHTVKGVARTLGLKAIATAVHDAEEYYSNILRNGAAIEAEKLSSDLANVEYIMAHYQEINQKKLNRGDELKHLRIDRSLIEQHQGFLEKLLQEPERPVSAFIELLEHQNQVFQELVFEKLEDVLESYSERASKIAKDLAKSPPAFLVEVEDINISRELRSVLDNCMIHILRNALDHGIESDEERELKAKPRGGKLEIRGRYVQDRIVLDVLDDGRGLAIAKLKSIGLRLGTLEEHSSLQEIADTIFVSGSSTAETISNISGRGVGMEAVRSYLKEVGASIEVKLLEPKDESKEFYNFYFEINLPLAIYDARIEAA